MVGSALKCNSYYVNNLNFNPSLIKTYHGFIFDRASEEYAFIYERNDAYSYDS